jgi:HSP20 family protein
MRHDLMNRQNAVPAGRDYFLSRVDGLLDAFFGDDFFAAERRPAAAGARPQLQAFTPRLDLVDTKDALKIKAELPGLEEKDVEIALEKDQLVIKGEKRNEHKEEHDTQFYFESSFGQFERRIALPQGIDRDRISADFKNGVLTVLVPKSKEAVDQVKKIAINGGKTAPSGNGAGQPRH